MRVVVYVEVRIWDFSLACRITADPGVVFETENRGLKFKTIARRKRYNKPLCLMLLCICVVSQDLGRLVCQDDILKALR